MLLIYEIASLIREIVLDSFITEYDDGLLRAFVELSNKFSPYISKQIRTVEALSKKFALTDEQAVLLTMVVTLTFLARFTSISPPKVLAFTSLPS